LVALIGVLGACRHDDGVAVATVKGPAPAVSPSQSSSLQQELAFVSCMRKAGIDMPDPTPGDTTGRSALIYELDVLGQGSNPAFQTALSGCMSLLPPPPAPSPVSTDVLTQELAFAKCMRDNGVKGYPDPNPDGTWKSLWIVEGDKVAANASRVCDHLLPKTSASASASS